MIRDTDYIEWPRFTRIGCTKPRGRCPMLVNSEVTIVKRRLNWCQLTSGPNILLSVIRLVDRIPLLSIYKTSSVTRATQNT